MIYSDSPSVGIQSPEKCKQYLRAYWGENTLEVAGTTIIISRMNVDDFNLYCEDGDKEYRSNLDDVFNFKFLDGKCLNDFPLIDLIG